MRYYLYLDDKVLAVFDEWVPGFPDTVGRWEDDGVLLPKVEEAKALMPGSYHGGSYADRWCVATGSRWEYTGSGKIRVLLGAGVWVDCYSGEVIFQSWIHCVHVLYTKTRVTKGVRIE